MIDYVLSLVILALVVQYSAVFLSFMAELIKTKKSLISHCIPFYWIGGFIKLIMETYKKLK